MKPKIKSCGIGTLSLVLIFCGILFSFSWHGICYGDFILNNLGISSWSNGNSGIHYTFFYSLLLFIPAFVLSTRYQKDFGAKLGQILSGIFILISGLSPFFMSN